MVDPCQNLFGRKTKMLKKLLVVEKNRFHNFDFWSNFGTNKMVEQV